MDEGSKRKVRLEISHLMGEKRCSLAARRLTIAEGVNERYCRNDEGYQQVNQASRNKSCAFNKR